jgi:hypothetical protein
MQPEQTDFASICEGFGPATPLAIGHAMAEKASDHADKKIEGWSTMAYDAFVYYSKTHPFFTTEDVRDFATEVPPAPDTRAWGAVALKAKRHFIVKAEGWVAAKAKNVHGNAVTLWRTL